MNYSTSQTDFPQLTKKHDQDAGLDICSNEDAIIASKKSTVIATGLFLEIPDGHVGLIWPRSGLSIKNQIEVGAGCIDASYRGEVKIHLYNFGDYDFFIKKGDRIAQLLTIPVNLLRYQIKDNISSTDRGQNGFGSTGV
jgi:dUTP pyrophosphatase